MNGLFFVGTLFLALSLGYSAGKDKIKTDILKNDKVLIYNKEYTCKKDTK